MIGFFPEIAADLRKIPDIAIDGELVMLEENGKPSFTNSGAVVPSVIRTASALRRE